MTPEGKVKASVKSALYGTPKCWAFMPVQCGLGKPALDFLFCVDGQFIVIETKAKGKKLTTRQLHTKAEMEAAGARVFVVDDAMSLKRAVDCIKGFAYNSPFKNIVADNALSGQTETKRRSTTVEKEKYTIPSKLDAVSKGTAMLQKSKTKK